MQLTKTVLTSQPAHMSRHHQYIVDTARNGSTPDGICALQQSLPVRLLKPYTVGKHRRIVANNHRGRTASPPSQNTNATIDHHIRSTENNPCATFGQALKSHAHQDHSNRWHIALMKRSHFVTMASVTFSSYLKEIKFIPKKCI